MLEDAGVSKMFVFHKFFMVFREGEGWGLENVGFSLFFEGTEGAGGCRGLENLVSLVFFVFRTDRRCWRMPSFSLVL